ncbi:unnamed protein product [Urochloa humidicola]
MAYAGCIHGIGKGYTAGYIGIAGGGAAPAAGAPSCCLRAAFSAVTQEILAERSAMVACMAFTLPSSSSTYCFFLCRDRCALSRLRTSRARRFASSSSPFPLPLPSVPLALLEEDSEDSSFLTLPSPPAPEEDDPPSGDPAEEDEVASGGGGCESCPSEAKRSKSTSRSRSSRSKSSKAKLSLSKGVWNSGKGRSAKGSGAAGARRVGSAMGFAFADPVTAGVRASTKRRRSGDWVS